MPKAKIYSTTKKNISIKQCHGREKEGKHIFVLLLPYALHFLTVKSNVPEGLALKQHVISPKPALKEH